jgi:glutathione S-transferase
MTPVQHAVGAALTGDPAKTRRPRAGRQCWILAYAWLETRLAGRTRHGRTLYAGRLRGRPRCSMRTGRSRFRHPAPAARPRARLLARPSFARAVEEARPYRHPPRSRSD